MMTFQQLRSNEQPRTQFERWVLWNPRLLFLLALFAIEACTDDPGILRADVAKRKLEFLEVYSEFLAMELPGPEASRDERLTWQGRSMRVENEKRPPLRRSAEKKRHKEVPIAVEAALTWLAAHQSPDGRWEANGFDRWYEGTSIATSGPGIGRGLAIYDVGVVPVAFAEPGVRRKGTCKCRVRERGAQVRHIRTEKKNEVKYTS